MKPTSWVGETYASQGLTEFPEVAQEQPGIFKRLAAAGEAASQFFFKRQSDEEMVWSWVVVV